MKILFIVVMAVLAVAAQGQPPAANHSKDLATGEKFWGKWLNDLHEMGVETRNDSLIIHREVMKLFADTAYRKDVYPAQYSWPQAVELLRTLELKKAFWHMLNLYETDAGNRSYVLGTFVAYDSLMKMDKILLSTFYTYAFADPRVSRVKNNKPDIFRPDILERKLASLKEIITQIWYYRDQKTGKK